MFSPAFLLLGLASTALAATKCITDLELYPYCYNVPDDATDSTKYPTVLFLSGRGARGSASDVQSLSTYDGFGKLVSQYNSGSRDEASTLAATKFITIVPVAPLTASDFDPQYWYPERLAAVLDNAKTAQGLNIDWNQFHVAGYSMGGFGSWRFAVNNPTMLASLVTSGGNAETNTITDTNGKTAEAPADQLSKLVDVKLPIRAFTGSQDTTIPASWVEQTHSSMESLGAGSECELTILDTDHSGLSTEPFSADLLNWMLDQKLSGSSTSATASISGSTTAPTSTKTATKSKGKSKTKTKTKAKATSTASASISTSTSSGKKCTAKQKAARRARRALQAEQDADRARSIRRHATAMHKRSL